MANGKSITELDRLTLEQMTGGGAAASFVSEYDSHAYQLRGDVLIAWLARELDGHGGINGIVKTSTSGLDDTYTITFADGTTSTFDVKNGAPAGFGTPTATVAELSETDAPTVSVTASGADTSKVFAFSFGIPKGTTGAAATVAGSAVAYQKSASGTAIPTGEWSTTIPTVASGEYLWTRSTVRFNTGSPIVWYSVAGRGRDGDGVGTVTSVNVTGGSGIVVSGEEITSAGTFTVGHSNVITPRTDRGVYPVKIDGNGHISEVGAKWETGVNHSAAVKTVTLSTAWVDGVQAVTDPFFIADGFAYTVAPIGEDFAVYGKGQIYADDVTTDGRIVFHALGAIPSRAVTVNVMRVVSNG